MSTTRSQPTMHTDGHETPVEKAREIVSAAARLLRDEPAPLPADGDLRGADDALGAARYALTARLCRSARDPQPGDTSAQALVLDSVQAQASVKDARAARQTDAALGVREALAVIRNASSTAMVAEQAPVETRKFGFSRALFSQIDSGTWMARKGFAAEDDAFADEIVAVGRANPRRLNGPLVESEMVRRGTPVMIHDAQSHPHVHLQLVRYADTRCYVAAPIMAWGVPVAMLHADHHTDGVDESDRHLLGAYTEAIGLVLERIALQERLGAIRAATAEYATGINAFTDDCTVSLGDYGITPMRATRAHVPSVAGPTGDYGEHLTPREWEVLRNLASGKTNAQIATGLFVTEGTVKSHVKHILRKLGASNRTEAVARYHRMVQDTGPRAG